MAPALNLIVANADRVVILERDAIVHSAARTALKFHPAVFDPFLGEQH
jgi:hypothetical protein